MEEIGACLRAAGDSVHIPIGVYLRAEIAGAGRLGDRGCALDNRIWQEKM
jgi:hypothetical protein